MIQEAFPVWTALAQLWPASWRSLRVGLVYGFSDAGDEHWEQSTPAVVEMLEKSAGRRACPWL